MSTKPTPAVLLEKCSKWYGQVIGINEQYLAIDEVTGILGPNGAGKFSFQTTNGAVKPVAEIRLFGVDPWVSTSPYRRVGYVVQNRKVV